MRPLSVVFALTWLGVGAGCSSPDATGPSVITTSDFTLTPSQQWAGGSVEVRSVAFTHLVDGQYRILAGADTLTVTRLDDSTVAVAPPDRGTRTVGFSIVGGNTAALLGSVQFVGFAGVNAPDAQFGGNYEAWPAGTIGATGVLGWVNDSGTGYSGTVATLDLRTGHVTTYSGLGYHGSYGPAPSYLPDVVTTSISTSPAAAVHLSDTHDTLVKIAIPGSARTDYLISPYVEFHTLPHSAYARTSTDSGTTWQTVKDTVYLNSTWQLVLSPTKGSATFINGWSDSGGVVLDASTGLTRYRLTRMREVDAAAFSPDGTVLYVAGSSTGSGIAQSLEAIDAATGVALHVDTLLGGTAVSAVMDPAGPQLFIAVDRPDGTLALNVYDASTLQRTATLHSTATGYDLTRFIQSGASMADRAVYVARSGGMIARFDVLPGSGTLAPGYR
ncbi:MAG TPA: hypothetical protein VFI39_03645 [Gemmatimonadales bacterium]|nr:hypothetical protein [Gemmatimonadales bacterium]